MESLSKALLSTHVIAGFLSLIAFWIPILTNVVLSAAILSIENALQANYLQASFLGFLSIITANPLWYGIATLKHKKGISDAYRTAHLVFNGVIVGGGLLLIVYGITMIGQGPEVMLFFFGVLGLTNLREVINHFKAPTTKEDWYKQHYSGMIITGIAAYTAFFVFGGSQFLAGRLPGYLMAIPWILPSIIGTGILVYMGRSKRGLSMR